MCICVHPWLVSGEVLDRIAVTVDKHVITLGDVTRELRVDAFLDRKPVDLSAESKRKGAARLVDQVLMLNEAAESHLTLTAPDDATRLLAPVKAQYGSNDEYRAALAEYHITEADLSSHLMDGLQALRFTDLRFRPQIQLSDDDIRAYYERLAAEWSRNAVSQIPPLSESRGEVEKLLTDQRVMEALDTWLDMQRTSKQIQYREAAFK